MHARYPEIMLDMIPGLSKSLPVNLILSPEATSHEHVSQTRASSETS